MIDRDHVAADRPVTVRLARLQDVPQLNTLADRSIRSLGADVYDARQIESSLRHLFGIDTTLITDRTYYIAELDGVLVGCGGWSKRRTPFGGDQATDAQDAVIRDPTTEPAVIRAFFVDPDATRRGVGRRILAVCEAAAREAGYRHLELVATRMGEPFYAAHGYEAVEDVAIHLPDGVILPNRRMIKRGS